MEPLGALAGSGAALIGFASSFVSASIGGLIARQFDGTITPIFIGHFVLGLGALITIFITERGKLMQPHHHGTAEARQRQRHDLRRRPAIAYRTSRHTAGRPST